MAIELDDITSGYNLSKINTNFQKVEDYINDKVLHRAETGVVGESKMEKALDMDGNNILNAKVGGIPLSDIAQETANVAVALKDGKYGYSLVDSFQDGATLNYLNEALRWKLPDGNGEYYRWDGDLPKVVAPGSTPTPVGAGGWISIGDAALRSELNSTSGASLVRFSNNNTVESLTQPDGGKNVGFKNRTVNSKLQETIHSGDYSSVQAALDDNNDFSTVTMSKGTATENLTVNSQNLIGEGNNTVLSPTTSFSTAATLKASIPYWKFRNGGNFTIDGKGLAGTTGLSFDTADAFSGRYNFENMYFSGLNTSIRKPTGNIGNTFRNIGINGGDWAYYAKSHPDMHIGADTLYNFHIDDIDTYSFYLNATIGTDTNPSGGGIGGWWLKDSIVEGCTGGGIYLQNKNGDCPTAPCGISNVWFEAAATGTAVQVDGVAQKPRILKLIDTSIFYAEYSYINNIELHNSNLVTYGCRFDNADGHQDIVLDASSTIKAHDAYLAGSSGKDVIVESIASQSARISSGNLSLRGSITKGRLYNVPSGNKLKAITFDSGAYSFVGGATVVGIPSSDGLHSQNCMEFSFPGAGAFELVPSKVTITNGNWYVWGANARLVSGTATSQIAGGITLGDVYLKSSQWISTFGVGKASAGEVTGLLVSTAGGSGATIRFADYFIAEFSTEHEALAFANTRMCLTNS